jgi:dCMP deaminase
MPLQSEIDSVYIGTALLHARLSKAVRKQVGAVMVTPNSTTLTGYNGTPSGTDNLCEDTQGKTKLEVLHAELNCLLKAAKEGVSVTGSTLYVTLSPCMQCSAMLLQAGVKRIVYLEEYRDLSGIDYLDSHGVEVDKFETFYSNLKGN